LTGSAAAAFGAPILRFPDYMELVGQLKPELDKAEGFISLERFESITAPGKFVSLQFWRDEESVAKWRNVQKHREAQKRGRGGIFASYRLRIAGVIRGDYHFGHSIPTDEYARLRANRANSSGSSCCGPSWPRSSSARV